VSRAFSSAVLTKLQTEGKHLLPKINDMCIVPLPHSFACSIDHVNHMTDEKQIENKIEMKFIWACLLSSKSTAKNLLSIESIKKLVFKVTIFSNKNLKQKLSFEKKLVSF